MSVKLLPLTAALALAFPVVTFAAQVQALVGEYATIDFPDHKVSIDQVVTSNDGKLTATLADLGHDGTLYLNSDNAEINVKGLFWLGGTIKKNQNETLNNLKFNGGSVTFYKNVTDIRGTLSYFSDGGMAGSYVEVGEGATLNVGRLEATSYYSLKNVGTTNVGEIDTVGMVRNSGGTLNVEKSVKAGHFWNTKGGTVNAETATFEIVTSKDMMPKDYDSTPFVHADGNVYTFGNGIDREQNEENKAPGTMKVGTLIVHGNALNSKDSTLTVNKLVVDNVLNNNDVNAVINVNNGSAKAKTVSGAQGTLNLEKSVLSVQSSSELGTVVANNSNVMVDKGTYAFKKFDGKEKTLTLNDLSATVTIDEKVGSMTLAATKDANDQQANVQETVKKLQSSVEVKVGDTTLDKIFVEEGAVNNGYANGQEFTNTKLDAFGSVNALSALTLRHEMNSLSKRMGELRDAPAGVGAWVRGYGSELEYGAQNVKAKNNSIQVGSDYTLGDWKVGAAFSYTDGESSYDKGSADNKNYGIAVYGTWFVPCGAYVDLMAKYNRLDNDFALNGMNGSFDNDAFTVSAETGYRFNFMDGGVFVEPQVGLSYGQIKGETIKTSNGVTLEQDDYNSLIGRVGVRTGFKFPKDKGTIYARVSSVYDFDGEVNGKATLGQSKNTFEADLGGSWLEMGVGANFNWTKNTYTYVDFERTNGGDVKENYRWNIGVRHNF